MKEAAMFRIFPLLVLVLLIASAAHAEDAALAALFKEKGVRGTMIISRLDGAKSYVHDDGRAATRFSPASTFKIPNTLIALDAGVITETETLKWDGKDRGVAAWNRDQTLESAFRSSCVWFYQELTRRVGTARYESTLSKIRYGNGFVRPDVTTFWLDGDLRISAIEQVEFLKRLYVRRLPFKPAAFDTLKRIMLVEETPQYTLWGKTGLAGSGKKGAPQTGWYVGYVEVRGIAWFFALNMDIEKPEDAGLRQGLVMAALKAKGII